MAKTQGDFQEAVPSGKGDHVVAPGETLDLIALRTGHFWQTIWDDPANAELKKARQDHNVLLPGDRLTIPPLRQKQVSCRTGAVHRFKRRGVPSKISFDVKAQDGEVFSGKKYELAVGDRTYEGTTNAEGRVEVFVAASSQTGMLKVWLEEEGMPETVSWKVRIGTLLPVDTVRGVQQRLKNLGYPCGREDGVRDEATRRAVSAFQTAQGLEVSGEMNADFLAKLRDVSGA